MSIEASGDLRIQEASITTQATSSAAAGGGAIALSAGNLLEARHAVITSSVALGEGGGGDIGIEGTIVALNATEVRANADAGNGGNITIEAGTYIGSADTVLDASSNTGIDGEVTIFSPDVNLESGLVQLPTEFLAASRLLRPSCAARESGEREGSFVVEGGRGAPSTPEGMLLALDTHGGEAAQAEGPGSEIVALRGAAQASQRQGRFPTRSPPCSRRRRWRRRPATGSAWPRPWGAWGTSTRPWASTPRPRRSCSGGSPWPRTRAPPGSQPPS